MSEKIDPLAGKPVPPSKLTNVPRLMTAYYSNKPDPNVAAQRVSFGTSGHRGGAFTNSFNENHIVAISQAVCLYRKKAGTDGPLFLGMDTHALSESAFASALEVFAANGVETMIDAGHGYTPTPVISHAILTYNKDRKNHLADGIVITPSHNPPDEGGFKYNPTNGGPADVDITDWIQKTANDFIEADMAGVKRILFEKALKSDCVHKRDYTTPYVADLENIVDLAAIRDAKVKIGIDPLGGAAVHYWTPIIERYKIDATVVNTAVDPTFRFMTLDWDGKVRMDCSSPYAMQSLLAIKDKFDIAFANDTDSDRHGIVCPSSGLMNPNYYLAAMIAYLTANRPQWKKDAAIGKTVVSSGMIDKVVAKQNRKTYEVPVGFKWFSAGLIDGSLAFGGEESAGASFLRRDGSVWTTDKDGLVPALLAAEITAKTGKNPQQFYDAITTDLGKSFYERIDAPATTEQKDALKKLSPDALTDKEMAGDPITTKISNAPGNNAAIGGIKVSTANGWFAARPSGTEDVYKIYAESFKSTDHLKQIQQDAQSIVGKAFGK